MNFFWYESSADGAAYGYQNSDVKKYYSECDFSDHKEYKVQLLMYLESALWAACALSCLLVSPYNAPFVIAGATFALRAIPAFTGLLIMTKKKTGDER